MKKISLYLILFTCLSVFSQNKQLIKKTLQQYEKHKNTNFIKANQYANKAVDLSEKLNDSIYLLKSYHYLGEILYKQRNLKGAEKAIKNSFSISLIKKNKRMLSLNYLMKSKLERRKNNFESSSNYLEEALKIAEKNNFKNVAFAINISKSDLFKQTKNYEKSYFLLRFLSKKLNGINLNLKGRFYNSYGISLLNKNRDSCIIYYKKAITVFKKTKNLYNERLTTSNLSLLLMKLKKTEEALNHLYSAEKIAIKIFDYSGLFFINKSLGIYHEKTGDYSKAIDKYLKAVNEYGNYVNDNKKLGLYWLLSGALWHNNQFKEGFECQEKYIELQDSLFTIDKNRTFEKLQTEYEVDKKNTQIEFLTKKQKLEAQQKKLILGIGGLVLIALILLVFIYKYRINSQKIIQKQEQQLFLQEKTQLEQDQKIKHIQGYIEGEEKEKNRISIELHDGIGGQLSGIKHFVSSLSESPKTKELMQNISIVSKEVRLLSHSLSSNYSLQQPFKNLLKTLQQRYENHFDIDIVLYPKHEIDAISDKQKLFLYRSIQELINNIYKYAKASLVHISVTISNEIVLIVEDNGIGFNSENIFNGIGLQNIKERTKNLDGEFILDTVVNRGTSVIIKIPIKNDASN